MWSTNSTSANVSKRSTVHLKPLKLTRPSKVDEQLPLLESITGVLTENKNSLTTNESWRKDLKLGRVVNRDRKKLSTATTSSLGSSTTDSNNTSREPLTPPPDLPLLDGQLRVLEDKFDVVENQIAARKAMFDNLDKDCAYLNDALRQELSLKRKSVTPRPRATFDESQVENSNSNDIEDENSKPSDNKRKSSPGNLEGGPEKAVPVSTWGDYLKSLW